MANLNTNLSTSTGVQPSYKDYYDKKLLLSALEHNVYAEHGQKRPLPENEGKTIKFRKYELFAPLDTPLQEGIVPDGQTLEMTDVDATIKQYGGYVTVSDMLKMTDIDPVINDAVELMGRQGGETIDTITRDVIMAGSSVQYANGRAGRAAITSADVLTIEEIRKAVRFLKLQKARQFMRNGKGYFKCFVNPNSIFDLQSDPLWQDVGKYQQAEKIENGEIGKLFGVIFYETANAKIFAGAGSGNIDVHAALMFGEEAYGVTNLGGANMKTIIKPHGSSGTSDPLDQLATIGWKVNGFVAKILQPTWMVRIEHAVNA